MTVAERRAVGSWLIVMWVLVLLMVMIGGVTRLTGSGLSIVEWKPVTGALPPLSEAAWQKEFDAYQASPQFKQQNHWMALADFKRIYFWEYVHRLFGRFIGLAFFVPWLYFVIRRSLRGVWVWRTFALLVLGGLQGALGWYMVKSGLVHEPRVSHYRLAAHLLLAVVVGQAILWQALDIASPREPAHALPARQRWLAFSVLPVLVLQIIYGAFMAGTRAGYVATTFPDMNGHYAPSWFFTSGSLLGNLVDNPLSIHYLHRAIGFVLVAHIAAVWIGLRKAGSEVRLASHALLLAVVAQLGLGALTVILQLPIPVAVAHQGGAYIVCAAAVVLCHTAWGASASESGGDSSLAGADLGQNGLTHQPHTLRCGGRSTYG